MTIPIVRSFSRHFADSWRRRVGSCPTPETVSQVVRDAVPVQPYMEIVDREGLRHRIYAIYWHPVVDVIIKVDGIGVARQVLSRANHEARRNGRKR